MLVVIMLVVVLMTMLGVLVLVVTLSMVLVHRISPRYLALHLADAVFIISLRTFVFAGNETCGPFPGEHLGTACFILKTIVVFANQFAELGIQALQAS